MIETRQCVDAFCEYMNKKGIEIGMKNSQFKDPAGVENYSNATDILHLLLNANMSETLKSIWGKEKYTISIKGKNAREMEIMSYTLIGEGSSDICDYYKVLRGKGGTLNIPKIYNTALIVDVPSSNKKFACVVMGADEANDRPNNRYKAAKTVIDIVSGKVEPDSYVCAESAVACLLPENHSKKVNFLYEKNAVNKNMPASISKLLTSLVVLEFIVDLDTMVTVTEEDIAMIPDLFYQEDFKVGDVVSVKELIAGMMYPSSNAAAYVLGRFVGEMILNKKTEEQ